MNITLEEYVMLDALHMLEYYKDINIKGENKMKRLTDEEIKEFDNYRRLDLIGAIVGLRDNNEEFENKVYVYRKYACMKRNDLIEMIEGLYEGRISATAKINDLNKRIDELEVENEILKEKFDYQYKAYVDRGVVIDKLSREIMLLKNEQNKIIKECTELKKDYQSYKKDIVMDLENFVDYVKQNSDGDYDDED